MPPDQLLPIPDLPLILHNDAAATTARFEAIGAEAAFEVVDFPHAGSLDRRQEGLEPASEDHERAGAVATLVAQHVRWVLLLRTPGQAVHGLAVDHTGADEACAADGVGFAQAGLPVRVDCGVGMGDLARPVGL